MQRQNKATKHYPVGPNIITPLLSPAPFSAPRDSRAAAPAPPQPGWAAAGREAGPVPGFPKGFLWAQVPQPSRPSSLRSRVTPCGLHTRLLAFLNNPFVKLFPNHPLCGYSWLQLAPACYSGDRRANSCLRPSPVAHLHSLCIQSKRPPHAPPSVLEGPEPGRPQLRVLKGNAGPGGSENTS